MIRYSALPSGHPNKISDVEYNKLVQDHIMFKDMSADSYLKEAGIAGDWPYGRGCYVSADRQFIVWVGEEDHLRIMCMRTGNVLNQIFDRLKTALGVFDSVEGCTFAFSQQFGAVTSCPTNLGQPPTACNLCYRPYSAGAVDLFMFPQTKARPSSLLLCDRLLSVLP